MSTRNYARQVPPGRRTLSQMSVPVLIAFVIVTVLTLTFRLLSALTGLIAEVSERVADAGDTARAAARGPILVTAAARGGAA
jgi:hypothetical protein